MQQEETEVWKAAASSAMYYARYAFSNDFPKFKGKTGNAVLCDNLAHLQRYEFGQVRDGKDILPFPLLQSKEQNQE